MEAPEKLYVDADDEFRDSFLYGFIEKHKEDDIEYTRTDVLIEKACNAYCKVCGHYAHSVPTHICRHDCKYFSDFKKYIKGVISYE